MNPIYKKTLYILVIGIFINLYAYSADRTKKILYIDSYNANLWSATIENGIHSVLDKHNNIELKIFRMDTKRFPLEQFKQAAALKAKEIIREWEPDVVIASDDNATKYLIVPYFMNSKIPFVFCGVNFDSSIYGFPTKNITGIEEVILLDETINIIKPYANGNKLGLIAADNISAHRTYEYLSKIENKKFASVRFVKDFEELKKAFIEIQDEVDMLFLYDTATVENFDLNKMIEFAKKYTIIPTFGSHFLTIKYALLGTPKIGEELGEWAANAALKILDGVKPSEIPITKNKQAKLYLNLPIANKLGIKFPIDLLDNSYLIYNKEKKILFLNLYYHKCTQNNDLENGIISSLNLKKITETEFDNTESEIELKYYKKDIHETTSEHAIDILSQQILKTINSYKPNAIIAINNNIMQYMLKKYYHKLNIPFILCNPNISISILDNNKYTDISSYKKSTINVINFAEKFSKGDKLGYIGINKTSSKELIKKMQSELNLNFSEGYFVSSTNELKNKFKALQKKVDIICFFEICQLVNSTNSKDLLNFFIANTKIPTIDFSNSKEEYALFGINKLTFEQGIIVGQTALQIISGNNSTKIKTPKKNNPKIFINKQILEKLDIALPERNSIY